jgi:hypothetical protein
MHMLTLEALRGLGARNQIKLPHGTQLSNFASTELTTPEWLMDPQMLHHDFMARGRGLPD